MEQILLVVHVIASISLIALILIQQGKGAAAGAAFGGGASNTVFGSQGSGSFLFKLTSGLATVFFITSLSLGYMALTHGSEGNDTKLKFQLPASVQQSQPIDKTSVDTTEKAGAPGAAVEAPARTTMKK